MQKTAPRRVEGIIVLFVTAFIWGFSFVFQRLGMDHVPPFTFGAARFGLGGLVLIPLIFLRGRRTGRGTCADAGERKRRRKASLLGGIFCGAALYAAVSLQQQGIHTTTTANAAFLTAIYIIIVPIYSIPFGKKPGKNVWIGVLLAAVGLYLLCIEGSFRLSRGDLLCFLCAFVYPIQILGIEYFAVKADPVEISCVQYFTCSLLCAATACFFETPDTAELLAAAPFIFYTGVMSCSVGYTLQTIGQVLLRNPSLASLCMSFESVFAAFAGWLVLHQVLSPRKLLGCAVMFAAILIAQRQDGKT